MPSMPCPSWPQHLAPRFQKRCIVVARSQRHLKGFKESEESKELQAAKDFFQHGIATRHAQNSGLRHVDPSKNVELFRFLLPR